MSRTHESPERFDAPIFFGEIILIAVCLWLSYLLVLWVGALGVT